MDQPLQDSESEAYQTSLPAGPFLYSRRVRWGDCDPARIAYTGNIPGMLLEAIEEWITACAGADWYAGNIDQGIGTPFVHLACDFLSPVTPRHDLLCNLTVERLGRSSVTLRIQAFQDDRLCVKARYVFTFVDAHTMRPIQIPSATRAAMVGFAERQGQEWQDVRAANQEEGAEP